MSICVLLSKIMPKLSLNPKLDPKNYKNCNDIANIKDWKARIISGNSMSDGKKKGQWEEVGYVWISLVDNTMIPLARSDEHHQGYDCIVEDLHINASDYYPVFLGGDFYGDKENNQYPYNEKEAKELKVVLLKLQYFGRDLNNININLHYILHDYNAKPIKASKFVEGKYGQEKYEDAELTPLGEKLVNTLEKLSQTYQYTIEHQTTSDRLYVVVNNLHTICDNIELGGGDKLFTIPMLDDIYEALEDYDSGKGSRHLESVLFYFGGIRNIIHNALRKRQDDDSLNKQLGNVSKIVEMISSI